MNRFYITTTLPYVNAAPHLGFALEIVRADALARYHQLLGEEVFFNTGTDEHGLKIARKAEEEDVGIKEYVDNQVFKFTNLKDILDVDYSRFIRTTDEDHIKAAQEFWKRCYENINPENGEHDIYKAQYQTKYCVGCELEKTDSELVDNRCPLHPKQEIELINEENYFFRFSRYGEALLKLYESNPRFVIPDSRLNEIKHLIKEGLKDFSISRLKSKVSWGVPVPNDEEHVMYVWFDALVNYISTLGWPENNEKFKNFWPGVQIAGKDNLRQQAAMWQAMLLSAKLPPSKQIIIHGFVTSGGEKMSKSQGNVIDPGEIVKEYGVDALRYWILREANDFEDSDFTLEKFKESYKAHLADGLGNLVSRVLKMAEIVGPIPSINIPSFEDVNKTTLFTNISNFELKKVMDKIWDLVSEQNAYIKKYEPYNLIKSDQEKAKRYIEYLLANLALIAVSLEPFMPEASKLIIQAVKNGKSIKPLFPYEH